MREGVSGCRGGSGGDMRRLRGMELVELWTSELVDGPGSGGVSDVFTFA